MLGHRFSQAGCSALTCWSQAKRGTQEGRGGEPRVGTVESENQHRDLLRQSEGHWLVQCPPEHMQPRSCQPVIE